MTIFRFRQKAAQLVRFGQKLFNSRSFFFLPSVVLVKRILLFLLSMGAFWYITDGVLNLESRDFDLNIMLALQKTHTPLLDIPMTIFSHLGGAIFLIGISVGLAVKFWLRRQRIELFGLLVAAGGGSLVNLLLKASYNRVRPLLWMPLLHDHLNTSSYPSGHVTNGIVIYGFFGYLLTQYFPRWRWLIYLGTLLLVLAIGWSRMYAGLHWPTDVLAGYATGFAWLNVSILNFQICKRREEMRRTPI